MLNLRLSKAFQKRKEPVDTLFLDVSGGQIPVRVRRHKRAKRMLLRLATDGSEVILTLPPRGSIRAGMDFARRHTGWVEKARRDFGEPIAFTDGATIPLRGEPHCIEAAREARGAVRLTGSILRVPGDPEGLSEKLTRYLKREARKDVTAAIEHLEREHGLKPTRISIRDTRSRWGSCSSTGTVSFSWRLILAPRNVLFYVVAHELAHLREMNHGPKFWALVAELDPNYEAAKRWLKTNGQTLHRYG